MVVSLSQMQRDAGGHQPAAHAPLILGEDDVRHRADRAEGGDLRNGADDRAEQKAGQGEPDDGIHVNSHRLKGSRNIGPE